MEKFKRLCNPMLSKSFFIFGPRGTGKSTLLKDLLGENQGMLSLNLLLMENEERFSLNPDLLRDMLQHHHYEWVIIDEVQKVPKLLDTVHFILEETKFPPRFALLGSSARKLKRGGANLLAGRAFSFQLFPLSFLELKSVFNLDDALTYGTLPSLYHLGSYREKEEYLKAYAHTYLQEEIWAEHLVDKLDPFRKFLIVAASNNGEIVNYSKTAQQVGVHDKTVRSYFQILEETLIGFYLEAFDYSLRKRLVKSPKFYLFDLGVKKALEKTLSAPILPGTYEYGKAFEHFILCEIKRIVEYFNIECRLTYYKTSTGVEVDLILERPRQKTLLIEIKSKNQAVDQDIKSLKIAREDFIESECYLVSQDKINRTKDGVHYIYWQDFLTLPSVFYQR